MHDKSSFFDLDGLLIDSEILSYQIYNTILKEFGYEMTIEEYAQNYSGKTGIKNAENIIASYELPMDLETLLEKNIAIEKEFLAKGVDLKPGARELLAYLKEKQVKTAVASSSTPDRAFQILDQHQIKGYFDKFVFGNEVERGKPNPDIFLKACEKIGEKPEDCLVLEDSEAGIQAAHSANIPVICIPDMKMPSQKHLEMTAAVLESLDNVITQL